MEFKIKCIGDYKDVLIYIDLNEIYIGRLDNDEVEQLSITLLTTAYKLMKNDNLSHEELIEWMTAAVS